MQTTLPKINFSIQTKAYQGPFELVLELIEARKLLVNDLALASITEDFIQHVRSQEEFPVEETANFIHCRHAPAYKIEIAHSRPRTL